MSADVTPLEYWLLDIACEYPVPFCDLTGSRCGEIHNRRPHGAAPVELADALERLLRDGLLAARGDNGPLASFHRAGIERAFTEYDPDAVVSSPRTWFELTARGGAVWEELSHANWDRLVNMGCGYFEARPGWWYCWMEGGDPGLVECALRFLVTECRGGDRIARDAIHRTEVRPWVATYWKSLPVGYGIRFVGDPGDNGFGMMLYFDPISRDPDFARCWPSWYARPFR